MANPIINETLMLIEVAIKKLVRTDPVASARLRALQGKVLALELSSPPLKLFVLPVPEGLEFSFDEHPADCTLKGAWVDFLEIAEDEHRLFGSGVEIHGDMQLARELKAILVELDIDWEGLLGNRIGELPAHQLAFFFRSIKRYAEHTSTLLADDLSDYLHEELRVAPSRPELQQFYQGVDELRLKVDRLQARLEQLEPKKEPESE